MGLFVSEGKKIKKNTLGINAILNGTQSVLNLIFPLITFPYVSRVLSVNGMGIYNFSYTYVGYFLLIAGLGINTYAVREGAKYRDNFEKISKFSSQIFSINILSTICAYLLLCVTLFVFKNLQLYYLCIVIFSLQIFFTTLGVNWLYIIYEDYTYITTRNILFKIISIILLFVLVKKPSDYIIYAGITVLAGVGSNILNYYHAKSFIKLKLTFNLGLRIHLKPILIIFASVLGVNIYLYADNTILGLLKGDYAVGIYSVSTKIYKMSEDLLSAVLTVTIPRLSMLYGKKLYKEYSKLLSQLFNLLMLLSLPAATGLIMLSKDIVLIIAGEKYLPSANSLAVISSAIVFSLINWIFADCVLLPSKRENKLLITTTVTAVLNILVNIFVIPFWSYDGASFSTVVSELTAMCLNGYFGWNILRKCESYKLIATNMIEALLGCLLIIGVCLFCNILISSVIYSLITSVILSVLVYGTVLLILRNPSLLTLINSIFKKS